jgi:hypothetical protein
MKMSRSKTEQGDDETLDVAEICSGEQNEDLQKTHKLINRTGQSKKILLDCKMENIPVFDVDRYCSHSFSSWHEGLLGTATLTSQLTPNLLDGLQLLMHNPVS